MKNRHRAYGDARATALLFQHLIDLQNPGESSRKISSVLDISIIQNLPEETGVYYFLNNQQDIIYVGKSKNIKSRILSHFQEDQSCKGQNMIGQITDVSYEVTGSELVALLKE